MPENKYIREIYDLDSSENPVGVEIDVYEVLEAFKVTCPARQHAIKKLLCAGLRNKGDALQDLQEAASAVGRACALEIKRKALSEHLETHASSCDLDNRGIAFPFVAQRGEADGPESTFTPAKSKGSVHRGQSSSKKSGRQSGKAAR